MDPFEIIKSQFSPSRELPKPCDLCRKYPPQSLHSYDSITFWKYRYSVRNDGLVEIRDGSRVSSSPVELCIPEPVRINHVLCNDCCPNIVSSSFVESCSMCNVTTTNEFACNNIVTSSGITGGYGSMCEDNPHAWIPSWEEVSQRFKFPAYSTICNGCFLKLKDSSVIDQGTFAFVSEVKKIYLTGLVDGNIIDQDGTIIDIPKEQLS